MNVNSIRRVSHKVTTIHGILRAMTNPPNETLCCHHSNSFIKASLNEKIADSSPWFYFSVILDVLEVKMHVRLYWIWQHTKTKTINTVYKKSKTTMSTTTATTMKAPIHKHATIIIMNVWIETMKDLSWLFNSHEL